VIEQRVNHLRRDAKGDQEKIRKKVYSPPPGKTAKLTVLESGFSRLVTISVGVMAPRILIAEDRATMRTTLRSLFTLYSKWDVCGEAVDGRQAVDAAIALKPDLVLLDYKMANGDGMEAASEIKEKLPNTPIVIFTLYKTEELELQARKVGVTAVVGKEEGVVKLLNTIEGQLNQPLI